jgi:RNA polymerase sigma factor (sigma-70 family)
MDNQELALLVEKAQAGDVEAFAQMYNVVSKSLYYYALKMTRNEHDAKDVVQETMIEVYKHLGELKNPGALKAYVNSVAYRRSINLINKNKRQQSDDIDDFIDLSVEEDEFLPQSYAESKERREYIIRLVDELPDAQKTVVLLYYYNQLSSKEIADMLDIEDGAVRARLNRARATLKQRIEDGKSYHFNGKGLPLMAFPVLTKAFMSDASAIFSEGTAVAIWENLKQLIG